MANGDAPAPRAGRGIAVPDRPAAFESFVPAQCQTGDRRPARPRRNATATAPVGPALVPESSPAPPCAVAEPSASVAEPVAAPDGAAPQSAAPQSAAPASAAPQYAAPEGAVAAVLDVMSRAQGGDPTAFAELYDHYVDLVYRYIYYRVGSAATAEDLTSETFLRALRRISSFTWQGRDPGAWFVTIARNLVADHYKSGRYRFEVTTADMLDAGADRPQDSPEGEVLDAITHATLLEAVKRLNPEQQECIVLRFLQGFSVAETARAMNKNEGAIKALQYRAVRTLGRLLPAGLNAPERA